MRKHPGKALTNMVPQLCIVQHRSQLGGPSQ